MSNLGERLKKEREMRGVSLDEIAAATRIQKKFLEALEENRYDAIPAAVFIIGFLRAYSSHLGMDTDAVIAEYEAVRGTAATGAPDGGPLPPPRPLARPMTQEAKNFPLLAVAVVASVIVVAVAAYVFRPAARHETRAVEEDLLTPPPAADTAPATVAGQETPAASAQLVAPAEEILRDAITGEAQRTFRVKPEQGTPHEPANEPAKELPKEKPAAVADAKPKEEPKPHEPAGGQQTYKYSVGLSALAEDVWVYVLVDGTDVRDMYIRSQQTVYLRGNKSFMLTTGNARALRLKVNGKYTPIPGAETNKVIRNWQLPLGE